MPVPVGVHAATAQLRSVLASYGGHLRFGAAFGVWQAAWRRGWLQLLFRREGRCAVERWPVLRPLPRRVTRMVLPASV